jgi:hypothetical protein
MALTIHNGTMALAISGTAAATAVMAPMARGRVTHRLRYVTCNQAITALKSLLVEVCLSESARAYAPPIDARALSASVTAGSAPRRAAG